MKKTPDIVPVTDFRRHAARLIRDTVASDIPVFITQCGYVTAVVISRERYSELLHRSDLLEEAMRVGDGQDAAELDRATVERAAAEREKVERRRRGDLAMTRFGLTDIETAEFLESEGMGLDAFRG